MVVMLLRVDSWKQTSQRWLLGRRGVSVGAFSPSGLYRHVRLACGPLRPVWSRSDRSGTLGGSSRRLQAERCWKFKIYCSRADTSFLLPFLAVWLVVTGCLRSLKVSTFFADSKEEESAETIPAGSWLYCWNPICEMTVYRNDNQHLCPNARGQLPVACDGVLLLKEFEREIWHHIHIYIYIHIHILIYIYIYIYV